MARSPQVRINVENLDRLMELTDAQMRVWLYYKRREGADGKAYGKSTTIAAWCGYTSETSYQSVKNARSWLRKNRWLTPNGKSKSGLPMFLAVIPQLPLEADDGNPTITVGVIPELPHGNPQITDGVIVGLHRSTNLEEATESTNQKDSVLTDGVGSEEGRKDSHLPFQNQNLSDPVPLGQEQQQNQNQTDELYSQATALVLLIYPNLNDQTFEEQLPYAVEMLKSGRDLEELIALLKWNRLHKSGALVIRSAKQFAKCFNDGFKLENDYDIHEFQQCPKCKSAGMKHWKEVKEAREMAEANAHDAKIIAESLRDMSGGVKDAYRAGGSR
jgi:predicted Zn-ribbon and HTH transcriptional regulator